MGLVNNSDLTVNNSANSDILYLYVTGNITRRTRVFSGATAIGTVM